MSGYPFKDIESKWKKAWDEAKLYETDLSDDERKLYCLVMFIYPSGDRLHIGHWYNYAPTDTWARFKRMQGYNVMEPMGYDAFGLPAENYAIKKGVHPADSTADNINAIRKQLKAIGAMYDWTREINTSSPEYYRWTQWLFLQLYKKGLAYRKKAAVNWCPSCATVLANEQVIDGQCERCDSEVTHKDLEQWFFKTTDYADRLLEGLERVDWPDKTVTMQRNWIGRSEGAYVNFKLSESDINIEVFTTRPDTLWGVSYMVLAPEHALVSEIVADAQKTEVEAYVIESRKETEIDRTSSEKEKTGVFTGAYCINPVNGEKIPIWIADYVLVTYGSGAVMAVPAHDERDFEFATKFNLPVTEVISHDGNASDNMECAYTKAGIMINSGPFEGQASGPGIAKVISYLDEKNWGGSRVNYKLRDWLISRQRYWGAPIPIITCPVCGDVAVAEEELPVKLPRDVEFSGAGKSPLSTNAEWMNADCPKCGGPGKREVDTMDTFVCSSWYFLRFPNPDMDNAPFDKALADKWLPVDQYVGGAEHAVMHLMYARFVTKALYDMGFINFDEPFKRLVHQGIITNNGAKMSKSKGNVVNPDGYIDNYGSDTFRMYVMFMGSYTEGGDWSDEGIHAMNRFVNRVWRLVEMIVEEPATGAPTDKCNDLIRQRHYAVKNTTADLERFQFNTSISRIMELVNVLYLYRQNLSPAEQGKVVVDDVVRVLVQLMAPFTPHMAEELWEKLGHTESIFNSNWPEYDESKLVADTFTLVIQVNGKLRAKVEMPASADEDALRTAALNDDKIKVYTEGKTIHKVVVVKNKLVSIVVSR
ncbi:leucine--tRNA ligase [bacterium]|nr:leucine--tRNA ligase [bacterium]